MVPVGEIDPRLQDIEDWQLLLALHNEERAWDGLITTDSGMLSLPRELAVLCQTRLTLVVPVAAGHDPLRATGLVLTHLPSICRRTSPDTAQVWRLNAAQRKHDDPWEYLARVARQRGKETQALYRANRLKESELSTSPLGVE